MRHRIGNTEFPVPVAAFPKAGNQPKLYERGNTGLDSPRNKNEEVYIGDGHAPQPGAESSGPTMFDMVVELRRAQEVSKFLLEEASNLLKTRTITAKAFDTTSAAGLLDLPIYQVPAGMEVVITRWNVDAVGFTPAVPYTNATGYLALFSGLKFTAAAGSMVDFLPNPPAASGAIIPASVTDGATQAGLFRAGEWISLHVQSGPATTPIQVRIQGIQRAI